MSQTSASSHNNKPRFSAGLVTLLVSLIWVALFVYFVIVGAKGFPQ